MKILIFPGGGVSTNEKRPHLFLSLLRVFLSARCLFNNTQIYCQNISIEENIEKIS
jgi:hypothetical protein